MNWLEILANPGVGNLLLLIAAVVGVVGSFWLYHIRLEDRRDGARKAIKSELDTMTILDQWVEDMIDVPTQRILSTAAYNAHLENIGLLTEKEVELLTNFYSRAILIDDILKSHEDVIIRSSLAGEAVDVGRSHREQAIAGRLDHLAVHRWQAQQILRKNLDLEYESPDKMEIPQSAGGEIHKKHPVFQENKEAFISKGYFEAIDGSDTYVLTQEGEDWIEDGADEKIGF